MRSILVLDLQNPTKNKGRGGTFRFSNKWRTLQNKIANQITTCTSLTQRLLQKCEWLFWTHQNEKRPWQNIFVSRSRDAVLFRIPFIFLQITFCSLGVPTNHPTITTYSLNLSYKDGLNSSLEVLLVGASCRDSALWAKLPSDQGVEGTSPQKSFFTLMQKKQKKITTMSVQEKMNLVFEPPQHCKSHTCKKGWVESKINSKCWIWRPLVRRRSWSLR